MPRDGRVRSQEVAIKFGRNLWLCRRRVSLSQEELGVLASLHRTEIMMLEHGDRLARIDTMMKLAGSLAVSPIELLQGIGWAPGVEGLEGGFVISVGPRRGSVDTK